MWLLCSVPAASKNPESTPKCVLCNEAHIHTENMVLITLYCSSQKKLDAFVPASRTPAEVRVCSLVAQKGVSACLDS